MEKEEFISLNKYFVKLVRWSVDAERQNSEPCPEKPTEISWADVYRLAEKHSFAAATYRALLKGKELGGEGFEMPEEEILSRWEHAYYAAVHLDIQQICALEEIKQIFAEKNLKIVPLKGLNLKFLYPETAFRQMGDLDILFESEKFEEVKECLEEAGYEYKKSSETSNHRIFERKPVLHLEMHSSLLPWASPYLHYYDNLWTDLIFENEPPVYAFTKEEEYIFMLMHAQKHFTHGGNGVRTIADFYLFLKKYSDEIDWGKVAERLHEADEMYRRGGKEKKQQSQTGENCAASLTEFEKQMKREVKNFFESAEVTIDRDGLEILLGGVYGTAENWWRKASEGKNKFSYLFFRAFPPYRVMKYRYKKLQKCPVLLPFYWIKRLCWGFSARGKIIGDECAYVLKKDRKNKKKK